MFEELFTRRAAIANHYAMPLAEERCAISCIAHGWAPGRARYAPSRLIRPIWFVFWVCARASASA